MFFNLIYNFIKIKIHKIISFSVGKNSSKFYNLIGLNDSYFLLKVLVIIIPFWVFYYVFELTFLNALFNYIIPVVFSFIISFFMIHKIKFSENRFIHFIQKFIYIFLIIICVLLLYMGLLYFL